MMLGFSYFGSFKNIQSDNGFADVLAKQGADMKNDLVASIL